MSAGLDPRLMNILARIESRCDRTHITGSYKGLFQLSDGEFDTLGGRPGKIRDARENARVAMLGFKRQAVRTGAELDRSLPRASAGCRRAGGAPRQPEWHHVEKMAGFR